MSLRAAAAYVAVVLSLSWAFDAAVFAVPSWVKAGADVMLIPGLVALAVRLRRRSALEPLSRPPGVRWLLFGTLYPLAFIAACAGIARACGLAVLDTQRLSLLRPLELLLPTIGALKVVGEEYGWRGYLLPVLARHRGRTASAALTGAAWALWHAPALYLLARADGLPPMTLCLVQMGGIFFFSFPFAYAYFESGSIVPTVIMHFLWNRVNPAVLGDLYANAPGLMRGPLLLINGEGLLGLALGAPLALWFAARMRTRP